MRRARFGGPFAAPISGIPTFVAALFAQRVVEKRVWQLIALLSGLPVAVAETPLTTLVYWAYYRIRQYLYLRQSRDEPEHELHPFDDPSRMRELVRVVPIGQSQQVRDSTIQMLSLEVYDTGAILNARMLLPGTSRLVPFEEMYFGHPQHPEPTVVITDDLGTDYPLIPGGG